MLKENTCTQFLKTWFWHSCRRKGRHLTFWVSKGILGLFWLGFCLQLDRPVTSWNVTLALYIVCLQHGGMWSTVYSPSNYGQWSIQVLGELPAPEKPVNLFVCLFVCFLFERAACQDVGYCILSKWYNEAKKKSFQWANRLFIVRKVSCLWVEVRLDVI